MATLTLVAHLLCPYGIDEIAVLGFRELPSNRGIKRELFTIVQVQALSTDTSSQADFQEMTVQVYHSKFSYPHSASGYCFCHGGSTIGCESATLNHCL